MSQGRRRLHLAGFLIAGPVAHSHALWRNPAHPVPFLSTEYYVEIARILERGRFDLIFFVDRLAIADRYGNDKTIGIRHGDQDSTRMDPMPILGALAATTRHLGLGATAQRPMTSRIISRASSARSTIFPTAGRHGMS